MKSIAALLGASLLPAVSVAFAPLSFASFGTTTTSLYESTSAASEVLELTLEKPLGMILEEVEEGQPLGVLISELADEGSAAQSDYKDQLIGSKVVSVMGQTATSLAFDDVMDLLINAPSPVNLEVSAPLGDSDSEGEDAFPIGTVVPITVVNKDGTETTVDAKVGDNLRATLLENNIEVYIGLKQKMGNCGGGGQCTFCAAEFLESEGWLERSDYEDQKLKRAPGDARLTCLNTIQGPAKMRMI